PPPRHITLRNQATALSSCRMLMGYQGRQINSQPVSEFELWQPGSGPQHSLWPGVIVLSTDFYESLQDACMPIDMRVMLNLKDSPMAMDVFTWLAHRLYRIEGGRPTLLHWPAIKAQFGQEYADAKDFKKQFRVALRRVLMQYPKARVQSVAGGLLLAKSPPPVAPRVILPSR
ncbi:replication protein RepA, partial [Xanthomonas citri]|uniref:replication protein RepA n=1 Tax=Xanthomonas citri TaxID=346 RepID=UPI00059096FA